MVRYTPPTFTLTLPETVDLTAASEVFVTFARANGSEVMTKTGDEIEVSEHEVNVFLSQAETARFLGTVRLQLNWIYNEGGVVKRACSEIASVNVTGNLLDEVIS